MRIFLTGATGFVGSHMLRRLLLDKHDVTALVRRQGALKVNGGGHEQLKEVEGDIRSIKADELRGCEAVINLVGIIYERGKDSFESVHHLGTRKLVEAAQSTGVKRFVQMSALGARPTGATRYHTTKFAAEEEVRRSGIPFVVLRPSLIFGPGSAFVQQMIDIMRAVPLIRPVPGTGKYRFRPVHVDDVVECFVQSLTSEVAVGRTIDLVGGEELTLDQIAETIASCLGIRKTVLHIPMSIMRAAATAFSLLPVKPPVTNVQLTMLDEGSTADPVPMERAFHIEPNRFSAGVRQDLLCRSESTEART